MESSPFTRQTGWRARKCEGHAQGHPVAVSAQTQDPELLTCVSVWSLCLASAPLPARQRACLRSPSRAPLPPPPPPPTPVLLHPEKQIQHLGLWAKSSSRGAQMGPCGHLGQGRRGWQGLRGDLPGTPPLRALCSPRRPAAGDPGAGWGLRPLLAVRGQPRESCYLNKLFIFSLRKASRCSQPLACRPRLGFLWPSSEHTVNFHTGSSSSLPLPLDLSVPLSPPHLPAGRCVCACVCARARARV